MYGTLSVTEDMTIAIGGHLMAFVGLTRLSESILCVVLTVQYTQRTGALLLGVILIVEQDSRKGGAKLRDEKSGDLSGENRTIIAAVKNIIGHRLDVQYDGYQGSLEPGKWHFHASVPMAYMQNFQLSVRHNY